MRKRNVKVTYRHKISETTIYFRTGEIPVNRAGALNKVWNQVVEGVTQMSIKVGDARFCDVSLS